MANKKTLAMIPSGYIPTDPMYGYNNPSWKWGKLNDNLVLQGGAPTRHGGWVCSYHTVDDDSSNVGNTKTCYLKDGVITEQSFNGFPMHPLHEDTGRDKDVYVKNHNGWAYQAKVTDGTFSSQKQNFMKFYHEGQNDRGRAYAYSIMYNKDASADSVDFQYAVNNNPKKYFWMSSLLVEENTNQALCHYNAGDSIGQVCNVDSLSASRVKNVVGFSMNVFMTGSGVDSVGLYPHTISLLMQAENDKRICVVAPSVITSGNLRLDQDWIEWREGVDSIKNYHDYRQPKVELHKDRIQQYTYICNESDINAIIQKRMQFVGINIKFVKIGGGGGGVHNSGTTYFWNFKPLCCDNSGVMASTWNTGRYNIWQHPSSTYNSAMTSFRFAYA